MCGALVADWGTHRGVVGCAAERVDLRASHAGVFSMPPRVE